MFGIVFPAGSSPLKAFSRIHPQEALLLAGAQGCGAAGALEGRHKAAGARVTSVAAFSGSDVFLGNNASKRSVKYEIPLMALKGSAFRSVPGKHMVPF